MESGKAFQSLEAAIQKARSPLHLSLDLGLKAEMWSADLKKVFKGLKIDFENPADTRLFYGTIWNNYYYFFYVISPF